MPEEYEENRPEQEEEDGGGAVKSFLDHLEDLRWTIIKSGVAVLILMIVCLAAGNVLMKVLLRPLEKIYELSSSKTPYVTLLVGTNRIVTTDLATNTWNGLYLGTNKHSMWNLAPTQIGTNWVLAFEPNTNAPPPKTPVRLLNLSPVGGFIVAFHLAIYGGIALGSPFIIYYVAQFILPALKRKEKKYLFRGFIIGMGLFAMGVSFCYFVLTPLALKASQAYSHWLGIEAEQWTAESYLGFVSKFMLGMGLGFELPVFLLIFVKLGVLDYRKLAGFRRYMIVINLILGAVLTTPEVLTQVMMAIPLQILYEITVWIAYYWEWKERKRQAAEEKSGND